MNDTQTASSTTPAVTESQPQTPAPQPQESWEARFKGLSRVFTEKTDEYKAKEAVFADTAAAKERLALQIADMEKAKADLEAKLTEGMKALEAEKANSAKLAAANTRTAVILAKNPDLLALDQKGLLRTDITGEEFEKYLENFSSILKANSTAAVQDFSAGATRPATPSAMSEDPDVLYDLMQAALKKGDRAAFDALNAKYINLPQMKGK